MANARTLPAGPVRLLARDGTEVGVFPDRHCAAMHQLSGETMELMSQEEFDREMLVWHADLARRGFVTRC